ncbi:MAG: hypothetical protein OXC60_01560 [Litoreibacter sp.]|nr:hypothetical protein [Litoreibacter sp.]MCY4333347.1 hypothetical protein [Litoreibacter sp.]
MIRIDANNGHGLAFAADRSSRAHSDRSADCVFGHVGKVSRTFEKPFNASWKGLSKRIRIQNIQNFVGFDHLIFADFSFDLGRMNAAARQGAKV